MIVPPEIAEALRARSPRRAAAYLVTSSLAGLPNLLVQPFTDVEGEAVLMPDLFAQKTRVNLNENPRAVLTVELPGRSGTFALEGPCNVFQWGHPDAYRWRGLRAGDVLARWGDWSLVAPFDGLPEESRPTVLAQRGVIALWTESIRIPGGLP